MSLTIAEIADRLHNQATTVLPYLCPAGEIVGGEFCVGSVHGEPGRSLKVSLKPEKGYVWRDFASGQGGGDLLDLWAAVRCSGDLRQATQEALEWLGLSAEQSQQTRQAAAPTKRPQQTTAKWVYRDVEGVAWIEITRKDTGRHKAFFQYDLKAKRAIATGGHQLPNPRPLYNLDQLQTPAQDVWFVEGEKAADALSSLGYLATTTMGGASSPHKTHFQPLAGRRVYVWPDNDKPGNQYALRVLDLLQAVDAVATVVSLPAGKEKGWDAADAIIDEGWGRAEVEALKVPHISQGVSTVEAQREAPPFIEYPCPDALWRGVFAEVAGVAKQHSWEVWLGTLAGLAALAHRQITVRYFGDLCGNVYGLLIKPTGTGKKLCTDICENLLPEWYMQTGTVSSGPGLMPILADVERAKDGEVLSVNSHPVMMILHEWTSLAKYLKIQFSSLSEDLNKIFDCPQFHSIGRSDREKTGGHIKVPQPTLSILGTTTEKLFRQYISEEMVFSGFLNRYLILPGSYTPWELYNKEQAAVDFVGLLDRLDLPRAPHDRFGARLPVDECYTAEAWNWFYAWGLEFFEHGLMNGGGAEIPMSERLHVYAHKIALLYAWSERADLVEVEHVEAARVAIQTSAAYLRDLADQANVEAPPNKKYEIELANRVLSLVQKKPGEMTTKKLYQNHLRKSASYGEIKRTISALIESGDIAEMEGRFYASK